MKPIRTRERTEITSFAKATKISQELVMKKKTFLLYLGLVMSLPLCSISSVRAEDVQKYIESTCLSCHAIQKPDFDKLGIDERINRKGPHLYYAGDKFNRDWLQAWLEKPYRIRPGGAFPPDHTVVADVGDVIDESTLEDHIAVPEALAGPVADFLMSLRLENPPQLDKNYEPKKVSPVMGKMDFTKFKGCAACHRDEPDVGGLSGPELYTAWQRLSPHFFISYIKNPRAWDPNSMMPNRHLEEKEIHKLVDYLRQQGE